MTTLPMLVLLLAASASVAFASPVTERTDVLIGEDLLAVAESTGRPEDYAAAEALLEVRYEAGDRTAATVRSLATARGRLGKIEAAVTVLREGSSRSPNNAELYDKLGYLYRYAGLLEASIASYRRAQALQPDRAGAEEQIAKAHIYMSDWSKARASHRQVRTVIADRGGEPGAKLFFYEGLVALYAGERDAAIRLFDASFAREPANLWAEFAQAYASAARGQRSETLERAAVLATRAVSDGERRYRLVHLYAMAGETAHALRHLSAAIDAGFFPVSYLETDRLTAGLRDAPVFGEILSRARLRQASFCRTFFPDQKRDESCR